MRSIKARFHKQEKKTPNAGAYINLQRAVRGRSFSRRAIETAFNQLVPAVDYDKKDHKELLGWLEIQSAKNRKKQYRQIR